MIEDFRLNIDYLWSLSGLIKTGPMSFGVKGLHTADVDRENR